MSRLKYIILDDQTESPIIFPNWINHSDMVQGYQKVLSAGFLDVVAGAAGHLRIACYGESVSLKIKSRPETDSKIIGRLFNS